MDNMEKNSTTYSAGAPATESPDLLRTHWRSHLLIIILLFLLAPIHILYVLPHISTHIPGDVMDTAEYPLNEWWTAHAILDLKKNPFYNDHIFFPLGQDMVQHTYTFLDGLLYTILRPFLSLVTFHNLLIWMTFFANSIAVYILILYLTGIPWLSFIGAFTFGHSPPLISYYKTPCLLELYTFVFFILFSLHLVKTRRFRWAVCAGIFWGLSLYNYPYYFLCGFVWLVILIVYYVTPLEFVVNTIPGGRGLAWLYRIISGTIFILLLFVVLTTRHIWGFMDRANLIRLNYLWWLCLFFAILWFVCYFRTLRKDYLEECALSGRSKIWYQSFNRFKLFLTRDLLRWNPPSGTEISSLLGLIVVVFIVAGIAGFPYFYEFLSDDTTRVAVSSAPADFAGYSVDLVSFFAPFNELLDDLYKMIASNWKTGLPIIGTPAFLGYCLIVVLILGVREFFRRPELRLWIVALIIFLLLSLGPYLKIHGIIYEAIPLPGYILRNLPLFESARAPSRYLGGVMLFASILLCLFLRPLLLRIRPMVRNIFLISMFFIISFEYGIIPNPLAGGMSDYRIPEVYNVLTQYSKGKTGVLLDLPLFLHSGMRSDGYGQTRRFYYQTVHMQRLIGGVSSKVDERVFVYFQNQPAIPGLQTASTVDEKEMAALLYSLGINWIILEKYYYTPENLRVYRYLFDNSPYLHNFYEDDRFLGLKVDQGSAFLKDLALDFWKKPDSLSRLIYPVFTRGPGIKKSQPLELVIPPKLWDYIGLKLNTDTISGFSAMTMHVNKRQKILIPIPQAVTEEQAKPILLKEVLSSGDLSPFPLRLTFYPIRRQSAPIGQTLKCRLIWIDSRH